MPQIKALVGHASIETAKAKRICSRHRAGKDKHDIKKGDRCLVVHRSEGKDNYCIASAEQILDRANTDLVILREELRK